MLRISLLLGLSLLFAAPGIALQDCTTEVDNDGDGYPADVDCDDNDASIHPDQEEPCICDGIDQNCNDIIDDFPCDMPCPVDNDGDGYGSDVDCDDWDASIHPDQEEPCICDDIDQNCNGEIDDLPCDIDCDGPGQVGDLCGGDHPACSEELVCCYPCGIQGCDNTCVEPCNADEPGCFDGCYAYP